MQVSLCAHEPPADKRFEPHDEVGGARGPDLEIAGCTECLLVGPARARARARRAARRAAAPLDVALVDVGRFRRALRGPARLRRGALRRRRLLLLFIRRLRARVRGRRGPFDVRGPARARCGDSASGNLKVTNEKEVPDWPGGGWVGAGPAIEEPGMTCLGFYPRPLLVPRRFSAIGDDANGDAAPTKATKRSGS